MGDGVVAVAVGGETGDGDNVIVGIVIGNGVGGKGGVVVRAQASSNAAAHPKADDAAICSNQRRDTRASLGVKVSSC